MPLTEKDRKLINELLSGESGAWSVFVDRYAPLIVQVIRHTAAAHSARLTEEDVNDLTADVFTALLDRKMAAIRGFRGRSSFATYLTVVVRRIVLRKLTQRRYLQAFGHVQGHQVNVAEGVESPAVRQVDARDEVDSLMTGLPESLRKVTAAYFLQGRSYREISRRLQIPFNSIGPMLSRARQLLQQRATSK
ncbi:MAG: sigma-70 family RNA polymerase sigma factor [Fuerstiella sp.]